MPEAGSAGEGTAVARVQGRLHREKGLAVGLDWTAGARERRRRKGAHLYYYRVGSCVRSHLILITTS